MFDIELQLDEELQIEDFEIGIEKLYPTLENLTVIPSGEEQNFKSENYYGYDNVKVKGIMLQDKTVTPTKESQTMIADENYAGLNEVTVEPIPDNYIEPTGVTNIRENGIHDVTEFANVDVNVKGQAVQEKDICFYDYDGTLWESWTLEELQHKTELPEPPIHEGLIFDGWNWTLEELKEEDKETDVGALYRTDDNKTRIYIDIDDYTKNPVIGFGVKGTLTLDWGDGTPVETYTGTNYDTLITSKRHLYKDTGKYVITLDCVGTFKIKGDHSALSFMYTYDTIYSSEMLPIYKKYLSKVYKIEFGNNIYCDGNYTLRYLSSIKTLPLPKQFTTYYVHDGLSSLKCYVFPKYTTTQFYGGSGSSNLTKVIFPSNTITVGSFGYASLERVTLPKGITTFNNSLFSKQYRVRLAGLPKNLKTISNSALEYVPLTGELILPETLTTINQNGISNTNISKLYLPNNMENILNGSLRYNYLLSYIKMPKRIKKIEAYSFYYNQGMRMYDFSEAEQVPTLANVNAFGSNPKNVVFLVPNQLYEEWKSATNWSNYEENIKTKDMIDLFSLEVHSLDEVNIFKTNQVQATLTYNNGNNELFYREQEGVEWSVVGKATIDQNGLMTLNEDVKDGDIVTVVATSTFNKEIKDTKEITVRYIDKFIDINLNDGQWVDSGTTVDGNVVYKSDKGTYNSSSAGQSVARIEVGGYTHLKLYLRCWSEPYYNYAEAMAIDTPAKRGSGQYTTRATQSQTEFIECDYEFDTGSHYIDIIYSKQFGGITKDDRGYFYIGEVS